MSVVAQCKRTQFGCLQLQRDLRHVQARVSKTPFRGSSLGLQRRAFCRTPQRPQDCVVKSSLCVDPSLPLWHQPLVHSAGLKCLAAVVSSFLAAQIVSGLLHKASKKARTLNSSKHYTSNI